MSEQTDQDPRLARAAEWIYRTHQVTTRKLMPYVLADARRLLAEIDGPTPTWRDVIRAMRRAGLKLAKSERISERWRYRILIDRGMEEGDVATNHLGDRWVSFYGREGWCVEMKNPTPAQVLTAARLVGLDGAKP